MLTDQSIQVDYGKLLQQDISEFDIRLSEKIEILNKHLSDTSPGDKLKIRIQQPKTRQYYVDLTLFNSVTVHTTGRGNNVIIALENAFTPLKENFLQRIDKVKDKQDKSSRQIRSQVLNQSYDRLQQHVTAGNLQSFSKELIPLIKDLYAYIIRHVRYAHLNGMDKEKAITSPEILNQTIEQAYRDFDTKQLELSLEHWLFSIADKVLSKQLREIEFEKEHTEDWDEYVEKEISQLEENMTMSAEGMPELVDDLDDCDDSYIVYASNQIGIDYDYEDKFSDKEQAAMVMKALAKIPSSKRKVFELNTIEGFTIDEIVKIHGTDKATVIRYIDEVRDSVKKLL